MNIEKNNRITFIFLVHENPYQLSAQRVIYNTNNLFGPNMTLIN
jgi:hypothetical protein